jgi:hypothetical protein
MSVDTSSFLADLLASVTEDLSKTKDPFDVLAEAVANLETTKAAYDEYQSREYNAVNRVGLYVAVDGLASNARAYGTSWERAAALMARGVMTAPEGDRYLLAGKDFNPELVPFAIERERHKNEYEDAVAIERGARREIDHTDLPIGTLVSLRTKDGNYYGMQVGTISKIGDSTYTVSFETWHPQHRHNTASATARLDRSDGAAVRPDGTCGYRYFKVLAGPGKIDELKGKMLTRRNAAREKDNLLYHFIQENEEAWRAYEQDQMVGSNWDRMYRMFGTEAEQKARDYILNKYRDEMMAMALSFQQEAIDAAGQRPEPTVPKPTIPKELTLHEGYRDQRYYWRNHASEHLIGLVDDLQAVIDQPIEGLE